MCDERLTQSFDRTELTSSKRHCCCRLQLVTVALVLLRKLYELRQEILRKPTAGGERLHMPLQQTHKGCRVIVGLSLLAAVQNTD